MAPLKGTFEDCGIEVKGRIVRREGSEDDLEKKKKKSRRKGKNKHKGKKMKNLGKWIF